MKISLPTRKPRNPFVAAALRRPAGPHRGGKPRQQAARQLQRELQRAAPRDGEPIP